LRVVAPQNSAKSFDVIEFLQLVRSPVLTLQYQHESIIGAVYEIDSTVARRVYEASVEVFGVVW